MLFLPVTAFFVAPASASAVDSVVTAAAPFPAASPDGTVHVNLHGENQSWTPAEFIGGAGASVSVEALNYTFSDNSVWEFSGLLLSDLFADAYNTTDFTELTFIQANGTTTTVSIGGMVGKRDFPLLACKINGTLTDNAANPLPALGTFIYINEGKDVSFLPDVWMIVAANQWVCEITVDGTAEAWLLLNNVSAFGTVQTVHYEYYDYSDNYSFNESCTGIYVRDLVSATSAAGKNYTLKFVAADGWAGRGDGYTYQDIEQKIQNPATREDQGGATVPLPVENPPLLAYATADGTATPTNHTFYYGAFRALVPGLQKSAYSKFVVEVRITTHGDRPSDIPGYPFVFVMLGMSAALVVLLRKHRQ